MQQPCGIPDATRVHRHIHDLLLDLRRLTGVGIRQEERSPAPQETLPAPVALFAFRRRAMSHNICALAVGAMEDLRDHCGSLRTGASVLLRHLSRIAHQQICNTFQWFNRDQLNRIRCDRALPLCRLVAHPWHAIRVKQRRCGSDPYRACEVFTRMQRTHTGPTR